MDIHIHFDGYAPQKGPQIAETPADVKLKGESDQDAEYRLMLKYSDKEQTLTPEEFEFLVRRGCVRY